MYNIILIAHILIVMGLLAVILVQRGRSGGLVEALGGVESIFGTKTNSFIVKLTVILAVLFFLSSISLVYLSRERSKSRMDKYSDITKEEPALPIESKEAPKSGGAGAQEQKPQAAMQAQATQEPQAQPSSQEPQTQAQTSSQQPQP
ncbi:MAG: preprotein translocase subunit SecG [Candidatus Omnitrophica bacterium]|nr:preprotein translocase subunit SecG [Candidatus Omnitrophota bacterium]